MSTLCKKSVCILMSTYNGENYIKEQIDSLLNQTYKNFNIYIRDDDSKDGTKKILEQYEKEGKIKLFCGENKGYAKSFIDILKKAEGFDYYAFCDQDDVWLKEKVEKAVEKLNNMDDTLPIMYFSNLNMYDQNLNFLYTNNDYKLVSFENSLVEVITSGNTMLINNRLREILLKGNPQKLYAHDWYLYMLATAFGEIYYDKNSYIKYRKHPNCVTDQTMGFFKLQIYRFKKLIVNGAFKRMKEQLVEFYDIYGDKLNEKDRKLLKLFANKKYNFIFAIKKVFYPHKYRQKIIDDILLRIMILFVKL